LKPGTVLVSASESLGSTGGERLSTVNVGLTAR
jgi:hypothetical protein